MLGKLLIQLRSNKGWSLADLAKKTGINKVNLHRYETGTKPKPDTLEAIASAYDLTPEELVAKSKLVDEYVDPKLRKELDELLSDLNNYTQQDCKALYEVLMLIKARKDLISKINELGKLK